jgi:TolB-like protein
VIEELTGHLVSGRKVTIVDRRNLALISQEMNLQLSGHVSDESAQEIGRMLGAQFIVSGNLQNMGTYYRFRIRLINVETAAIQSQISLNLQNDAQVAFLLAQNASSTSAASPVNNNSVSSTSNSAGQSETTGNLSLTELERIYTNNFRSNSPNNDEVLNVLNTLSAMKTNEADALLHKFLSEFNDRRRTGPWRRHERQFFEWVVASIGASETQSQDIRLLLIQIQRNNRFTAVERGMVTRAMARLGWS